MLALVLACSLASQSPPIPPPEGVKVSPDRLVIQTKAGYIVIALYPEIAPKHVVQIMRLVKAGVYDGTCIARIEPRFVLQFSAAENDKEPSLTSTQKAMLEPIDAEFSSLKHVRGVVSMAREDNKPNSARTSFSILLGDAPHLDGQYTIFGHVEYGMDVVEELIKAPLLGTRPRERLTVNKMQLVDGQELRENPPPSARVLFSPVPGYSPEQAASAPYDGPSPLQDRPVVFSVGLILMILCILVPMVLPGLQPKQAQTIHLISVLIGGLLLVAVLQPMSIDLLQSPETQAYGHLLAIGLFFGLLGIFRLMSSFESAA